MFGVSPGARLVASAADKAMLDDPMRRRSFLALCGALTAATGSARAATPESSQLEQHDLILDGDRRVARRSLLLVPKHAKPKATLPVLVLLHGLGEAGNEMLGIHAWGELYGLVAAYERLRQPPVQRTLPKQRFLTDAHREWLNASLSKRPFEGLVLVCPVTPNPHRLEGARTLDQFADWIADTLLPAVRKKTTLAGHVVGLDGCSMGGYVGWEVFLRKPELFSSVGAVQGAYGVAGAHHYAERIAHAIAKAGPRPLHVETSTGDPFRKANQALSAKLHAMSVPNELSVLPGPHNQPWLREIGTLEMLLWHSRMLNGHP